MIGHSLKWLLYVWRWWLHYYYISLLFAKHVNKGTHSLTVHVWLCSAGNLFRTKQLLFDLPILKVRQDHPHHYWLTQWTLDPCYEAARSPKVCCLTINQDTSSLCLHPTSLCVVYSKPLPISKSQYWDTFSYWNLIKPSFPLLSINGRISVAPKFLSSFEGCIAQRKLLMISRVYLYL